MAEKKTATAPSGRQAVKQFIYLGPNHPRHLLVNATIYKGGVPKEVETLLNANPSAKALLVETAKAAVVMQELRKKGSVYASFYQQADQELHRKEG